MYKEGDLKLVLFQTKTLINTLYTDDIFYWMTIFGRFYCRLTNNKFSVLKFVDKGIIHMKYLTFLLSINSSFGIMRDFYKRR